MERYITTIPPFDTVAFPKVEQIRAFVMAAGKNRAVWSPVMAGPGLNSQARRHGDFDDDPVTLDSIAVILRSGF